MSFARLTAYAYLKEIRLLFSIVLSLMALCNPLEYCTVWDSVGVLVMHGTHTICTHMNVLSEYFVCIHISKTVRVLVMHAYIHQMYT